MVGLGTGPEPSSPRVRAQPHRLPVRDAARKYRCDGRQQDGDHLAKPLLLRNSGRDTRTALSAALSQADTSVPPLRRDRTLRPEI